MRTFSLILAVCVVLLGCEGDRLSGVDIPGPEESHGFQDDLPSAVQLGHRMVSTSRTADEVDLEVSYVIDGAVSQQLHPNSRLRFDLFYADGSSHHLSTVSVGPTLTSGEIEVTIPLSLGAERIVSQLIGMSSDAVTELNPYGSILLPELLSLSNTDLGEYYDFSVALIPGSYVSSVQGNRRLHRFAVEVTGQRKDVADSSDHSRDYITGLEEQVSEHFKIWEGSIVDVESPVTVSHEDERVSVYFVMDASSSVVEGGTAHHVLDAVSRLAIALAPVAEFDYRAFSEDVRYLNSLRELEFDTGASSGTAFYHALNTALDDIEHRGPASRDSVLIGITDGIDRSSLNYYYPTFTTHEQVSEFVSQRVNNIRQMQSEDYHRNLVGHIVSLGVSEQDPNIDFDGLNTFSTDSSMKHTFINRLSNIDIQQKFEALTRSIRGVYYLEYSSQQVPEVDSLSLSWTIGEEAGELLIRPSANQGQD
ncbi:MAG: hypothetical protein KTR35_05285 [Gammaproteobacteria bacterium]|nr:hypothetical protein [Gammaproteobacteria bacterium]